MASLSLVICIWVNIEILLPDLEVSICQFKKCPTRLFGIYGCINHQVPFLWLHMYIVTPPLIVYKTHFMVLSLLSDVLSTSLKQVYIVLMLSKVLFRKPFSISLSPWGCSVTSEGGLCRSAFEGVVFWQLQKLSFVHCMYNKDLV